MRKVVKGLRGMLKFDSSINHFKKVTSHIKFLLMKTYNKLVRDKILNIIKKDGVKCNFHIANKKEYDQKLNEKLREEVEEFIEKPCAEEIADVLEVIEAIARINNIGLNEIKKEKLRKKTTRGGFIKKIIYKKTIKKRK